MLKQEDLLIDKQVSKDIQNEVKKFGKKPKKNVKISKGIKIYASRRVSHKKLL